MSAAFCTQCRQPLAPPHQVCVACGHVADGLSTGDPDPLGAWGLWTVCGALAAILVTSIVVSSLALWFALPVCDAEPAPTERCRGAFAALPVSLPLVAVISVAALNVTQTALVFMLGFRSARPTPALMGIRFPQRNYPVTALAILLATAASIGFTHAYGLATTALGWDALAPPPLEPDLLLPGLWGLASFAALAIWTPVVEETFFRGLVFRGLWNRWGAGVGLVLSAAVFAGMHFSLAVLLPIFVTGLLLGGLYLYTRSLLPAIIVHALQNSLALSLLWAGV